MRKLLLGLIGLLFAVPAVAADLPAGYTELQYIESTGTQWIDTGIKGNMSYKYEIDFQQIDSVQYRNWGAFNQQLFSGGPNMSFTYSTGFSVRWTVSGDKEQQINTISAIDANRHKIIIDNGNITWDGVDKGRSTGHQDNYQLNYNLFLGTINPGGTTPTTNAKSKYYSYKVWNTDGNLIQNFVPAKNASGVVGMYDTVSGQFFTNAGTGEFIAGPVVLNPCRNLYNKTQPNIFYGFIKSDGTFSEFQTNAMIYIPIEQGKTYTISGPKRYSSTSSRVVTTATTPASGVSVITNVVLDNNQTYTITPTATEKYLSVFVCGDSDYTAYGSVEAAISANTDVMQIEEGSTATEYVPFCATPIKIATTAYNAARFSPVVTELNDTIATIRSVVTNTINQTKAIADLQATKQTRPDETCPAGKKCLLVEDNDGTPHWFEIVESAD